MKVAAVQLWKAIIPVPTGTVFWPGGVLVVTVMTYRPGGAGVSSDVLAGRVAWLALRRFSG